MIIFLILSIFACLFVMSATLILYFKFTQFWCTRPECLVGKTAIVTGGCSGIGYEIVLGLAARGCKVIVADKAISGSKKDEFIKTTKNRNIVLEYVDLASFKSVRDFAERIKKSENKLDILFNNAGLGGSEWNTTEDGLHLVLQINYYSHFLLTHLLIDLLKKSQSGRILSTSSVMSFLHCMSADQLNYLEPNTYFSSYGKSKYLQIVAADKLADKLKVFNITSNSWHPVLVYTGIFRSTLGLTSNIIHSLALKILSLISLIARTPRQAVQTAIYLACADELQNVTGKFFADGSICFKPHYTKDFQDKVWKHSQEAVKLRPEERL